jgi:hypothetical protein
MRDSCIEFVRCSVWLLQNSYPIMMSVLYILQQQYKASGEQPDTMSRKEAAMFPFISSFTLVGLYVLYKVTEHLYELWRYAIAGHTSKNDFS